MTRTLFFLTALTATLGAMTAILMRIELAYPGVSPLFQTTDGAPDGNMFSAVTTFHVTVSYLCVTLLGTTMASAARPKGAPLSALFIGLGCLFSFVILSILALTLIPAPSGDQSGVGWVLYPPLSTQPQSMFDTLLDMLPFEFWLDPIVTDITKVFMLPSCAMVLLGAYAMVATVPSFRWLSVIGVILLVPITILVGAIIFDNSTPFVAPTYLIAVFPLLAFASIRLIDAAPSWLMILTAGLIITSVGQIIFLIIATQGFIDGTIAEPAATYVFPLGMAFFALPALILYDRNTDLPAWATAATVGAIAIPMTLWVSFLVKLGLDGMPARYVDYPNAFAADNLAVSANVIFFAAIYLTVITAIHRQTR